MYSSTILRQATPNYVIVGSEHGKNKVKKQNLLMENKTDKRLVFESAVVRLMDRMYGVALRYCRNEADAEDLVADTLVKAWKSFDRLEDRNCFDGWIMRILSNTYISQWRRNKTQKEIFDDEVCVDDLDDTVSLYARLHQPFLLWYGTPEKNFVNTLLNEDISKALDGLKDGYRSVIVMVEILGFSYVEVSESLEIPVGTVRSRLSRARSQMQDALWQNARDEELVPSSSSN